MECACHECREGITLEGNILPLIIGVPSSFFNVNVRPMPVVTRLILTVPGFGPDSLNAYFWSQHL